MEKKRDLREDGLAIRKKEFLEALKSTLGNVTEACKLSKMKRMTHYAYMESDPEYYAAVLEVREMAIDFAENALFKKMREGDNASIIFYLKTQGAHRGYRQSATVVHRREGELTRKHNLIDYSKLDEETLRKLEEATIVTDIDYKMIDDADKA